MKYEITVRARFLHDPYVGLFPGLEISGSGASFSEARQSLADALHLFLQACDQFGLFAEILDDNNSLPPLSLYRSLPHLPRTSPTCPSEPPHRSLCPVALPATQHPE